MASLAREFLKRENLKPPPNHRLYDLLAQAEVVEANEDLQCVRRIKVPGKDGPVELSAVIFRQATIIPERILPTLPNVVFELRPENPDPAADANSDERQPTAVEDPPS